MPCHLGRTYQFAVRVRAATAAYCVLLRGVLSGSCSRASERTHTSHNDSPPSLEEGRQKHHECAPRWLAAARACVQNEPAAFSTSCAVNNPHLEPILVGLDRLFKLAQAMKRCALAAIALKGTAARRHQVKARDAGRRNQLLRWQMGKAGRRDWINRAAHAPRIDLSIVQWCTVDVGVADRASWRRASPVARDGVGKLAGILRCCI
eukprot:6185098-Pleurochrysis_carterae.AAC.1